jgi:hypothetical protein
MGMPTWLDEQYTFMSAATVFVLIVIVWQYLQQQLRPAIACVPSEARPEVPEDKPADKSAIGDSAKTSAPEQSEASRSGRSSRRQRRRR